MCMKTCGIYKITSPSGKIYIGQSVDIEKRFKQYKNLINCKRQSKLYSSFLKHTSHNHLFEIIEECEFNNLNIKERFWQEYYNVLGEKGLNLKYVDTHFKKTKLSDETKLKLSLKHKGKKLSKEHIQKIIMSKKGYKLSEKAKENIKKSKQNISHETRKKMSDSAKGKIFSDETRKKLSYKAKNRPNNRNKKVINIKTGEVFESAKKTYYLNNLSMGYTSFIEMLNNKKENKTNFKYLS